MSANVLAAYARTPKFIYVYDSVVSGVMAAIFIFGAQPIADLVGWPAISGLIAAIGAFLISWALFNYALGTAAAPATSAVATNIFGDGLWGFGSIIALFVFGSQLNGLGQALLVGQAIFVLGVFAIKLRGWKALTEGVPRSSHLGKVTIS